MTGFARYAIYHLPDPGPLAAFGAGWLGWDAARGTEAPPPPEPALPEAERRAAVATPQRYGFHATIKPPFRLAAGTEPAALRAAFRAFCAGQAPVALPGLRLAALGRFLALVPERAPPELAALAGAAVAGLDPFRAPPEPAELARRRGARLSPAQEALLVRWGYPYVMEEFRFHMTLTGRLDRAARDRLEPRLEAALAPLLPRPYPIRSLCLLGEAADGRFHLVARCPLGPLPG
ncbi:DUF1045 domain-containing protein [Roseivivax sp. CAU 1761]